jgi:hypothetical protein
MSGCPFKFLFEWDADNECGYILREAVKTPLLDHNRRPIPGSSVAQEEVCSVGMQDLFGEDSFKDLPSGQYWAAGEILYSRDYFGECDMEAYIGTFVPANRRTRRAYTKAGLCCPQS